MREYLKCPHCGQVEDFFIDSVVTIRWNTLTGCLTETKTPQIFNDSYIRCNAFDCEAEGEIQDFWVGKGEWMRHPVGHDDMFLDDMHEDHKE